MLFTDFSIARLLEVFLTTVKVAVTLTLIAVLRVDDLKIAYWINYIAIVFAKEATSAYVNDPLLYAPKHNIDCMSTQRIIQDNVVSIWQNIVPSNRNQTIIESLLILCDYPALALEFMDKSIERCIDSREAYWIGRVYADLDDMEMAIACWHVGRDVDIGLANFGNLALKLGDADDALQYFQMAERVNPREDSRKELKYREWCRIQRENGLLSEALNNCTRLVRVAPIANSYIQLGIVQLYMQNYHDALDSFERAKDLKPKSGISNAYLGITYIHLGELVKAENEFLSCIQLSPDYPWAYFNLGELYEQQGRIDLAKEAFLAIVESTDSQASSAASRRIKQLKTDDRKSRIDE